MLSQSNFSIAEGCKKKLKQDALDRLPKPVNRKEKVLIKYDGQELSIEQWADKLNMSPNTIRYRHKHNFEPKLCLTKTNLKKALANREYYQETKQGENHEFHF